MGYGGMRYGVYNIHRMAVTMISKECKRNKMKGKKRKRENEKCKSRLGRPSSHS